MQAVIESGQTGFDVQQLNRSTNLSNDADTTITRTSIIRKSNKDAQKLCIHLSKFSNQIRFVIRVVYCLCGKKLIIYFYILHNA